MIQFYHDLGESPFLAAGLLAGLLASIACGIIGPYVITRRIVFLSGAIAHMAVGGIGAAILVRHHLQRHLANLEGTGDLSAVFDGRPWLGLLNDLLPTLGAIAAALAGAVIVAVVHHRSRERIDTLIGAMWAVGMSVGILLIKYTPGYHTELMSYLFGSIVFVPWSQIWVMLVLNAVIVAAVLAFQKRLLAVCLDEEQAELQGVSALGTNILLLSLVALTVICLIRVVGLILVLALLTLPAATAGHHLRRLASITWVSILLCAALTVVPRTAVYGTRISPESAIVLSAGAVYLISLAVRQARRRGHAGTF